MRVIPRRPYTLIHQPAPGGLELRLFRSSLPEPGVVLQIAWPHEPKTLDGLAVTIAAAQLDLIVHAAHATAHLPPPGVGREEHTQALQIITNLLGGTRAAANLSVQILENLITAGLNIAADTNPPFDEARAVLAEAITRRIGGQP